MRITILILSAVLLLATSASAADQYTFHVRVTDGRSALLANPDYEKLAMSREQLEKAAESRVVVLDAANGAHWRWMMLSWFADDSTVEQGINDRGGARPEQADFALLAGSAGHFRARCLRDACRIAVTPAKGADVSVTFKRGELSPDLPLDARVAFRAGDSAAK